MADGPVPRHGPVQWGGAHLVGAERTYRSGHVSSGRLPMVVDCLTSWSRRPWRGFEGKALSADLLGDLGGGQLALVEGEGLVLVAGVGEVLELDDTQVLEAVAEPAVVGVQQAQLLAVGNDLGE